MSEGGLTITRQEDVTVVDFRNAPVLHSAGVREIEDQLYALVDDQHVRNIALDFRAVRFLASQMLGVLVSLHKKAHNLDGNVVICGLSSNLYKVFQISRLDTVLHFADSLADGVRGLRGPAADLEQPPAPAGPHRGWRAVLNKQVRIFFAGALVLVPLAITVWVAWQVGSWLDGLGRQAFRAMGTRVEPPPGIGALIILAGVYVFGLLTHLWLFRGVFGLLERLVTRLPGVKTIYESVRDLMNLFGGGSRQMGRVVQYRMPGSDMTCLGILTNEDPLGLPKDDPHRKVAVYLPLSYMIGGPTVMVSPENIVEVDMSVEQCLKLCATAAVGRKAVPAAPVRKPADTGEATKGT